MAEQDNKPVKLSLEQATQLFPLTPDLIFVCKKIFNPTEFLTEDQWKEKLIKNGLLPKTKK